MRGSNNTVIAILVVIVCKYGGGCLNKGKKHQIYPLVDIDGYRWDGGCANVGLRNVFY